MTTATDSTHIDDHHDEEHHEHHIPPGIKRWLYTTNHKDIGTLYLWFAFTMFLIGGAMAMVIRAELFQPGLQIVEPNFFNQMTTVHGLIMVFGAVMPAFTGLANWLIPMMIGAPDMALPRMNNWSFWILPFAFLILLSSLFMEGGGPAFGWTFYAPLSTTYSNDGTALFVFAVHIHYGGHQRYCDYLQYACTRHDLDENAAVCLDMVNYCVFVDCCYACIGRCGDYGVDR